MNEREDCMYKSAQYSPKLGTNATQEPFKTCVLFNCVPLSVICSQRSPKDERNYLYGLCELCFILKKKKNITFSQ
jgi:hypothetical protein